MKKKTILISAVIAAATIIAFKHIFNKEEEEYFLNENYPFASVLLLSDSNSMHYYVAKTASY